MILTLALALGGTTFLAILFLWLKDRLELRRLHLDRVKARCKHGTVKSMRCTECTTETAEFFDEDDESGCPCGDDTCQCDIVDYEPEPETPTQRAEREQRELIQAQMQAEVMATMARLRGGQLSRTCVTCKTITYGEGARCGCFPI